MAFRDASKLVGASFYRGGTSRGLIFRDGSLAGYSQANRDRIICQATGSPDPNGRQIDGFGGGASSLSKVAIISRPLKLCRLAREAGKPLPGLEWLDDEKKTRDICDIIYRFGQVAIREQSVDWGSTCGNMLAAVAHYSISAGFLYKPASLPRAQDIDPDDKTKYYWSLRIIAHDTGKIVTAQVSIQSFRTPYSPKGSKRYWGPSEASGILIETPIGGSVLPTGNGRDMIELDGSQIEVSIVDTGLPVVFVSAKSLGIPLPILLKHPASIDANVDLMAKLEQVRQRACSFTPALQSILSPPSPKLCIVHPRYNYTTTGGEILSEDSMDLMIRTVSTGQFHRTVPATTLSALAAAISYKNSIVSEGLSEAYPCATTKEALTGKVGLRAITIGKPAGCSTATVKTMNGEPASILMMRTARLIMQGTIKMDPSLDHTIYNQNDEKKRSFFGREPNSDRRSYYEKAQLRQTRR